MARLPRKRSPPRFTTDPSGLRSLVLSGLQRPFCTIPASHGTRTSARIECFASAILICDVLTPFSSEWLSLSDFHGSGHLSQLFFPVQAGAEKEVGKEVGTDAFLGILPPGRGDWTILRRVKSMTCGSFVNHSCLLLPTCSILLTG